MWLLVCCYASECCKSVCPLISAFTLCFDLNCQSDLNFIYNQYVTNQIGSPRIWFSLHTFTVEVRIHNICASSLVFYVYVDYSLFVCFVWFIRLEGRSAHSATKASRIVAGFDVLCRAVASLHLEMKVTQEDLDRTLESTIR